ncbi:hypothetical protein [Rhizobium leguminosarum]|uniref:hypothetical protein n=1 Tax=Rhizobium leguminosarum TaxID=384 RepID=UPI0021BBE2BB|nr:hypothetical protein [Rhizobium leguminosarum]
MDQATFVDLAEDKSGLVHMRRQHDRHRRGRVVDGREIAQDVGLDNFGELSEQAGSQLLVSAWGGASISASRTRQKELVRALIFNRPR